MTFFILSFMNKEKKNSVDIVNSCAAGIDIGSRSHFVSIGQGPDDVKESGVLMKSSTALPPDSKKMKFHLWPWKALAPIGKHLMRC